MKLTHPIVILGGVLLLVLVLVGIDLMTFATNCGGNKAALGVCETCFVRLCMLAPDDKNKNFDLDALSESNRLEIATNAQSHWVKGANFFVRKKLIFDSDPKQIIVVCDHAYGNIPQPTFWNGYRKNPAHAVVYANGSTGLITPAQFKGLNLSEFIDASHLRTNEVITTNRP